MFIIDNVSQVIVWDGWVFAPFQRLAGKIISQVTYSVLSGM